MFKLIKIACFLLLIVTISTELSAQNVLKKARRYGQKTARDIKRTESDYKKASNLFSSEKKTVAKDEGMADTIIWEKKRYTPQRGMLNDYSWVFKSIHGTHQKVKFKNDNLNAIVWDSTLNKFYNRLDKVNALNGQAEVFGWHPYWMKDEYKKYRFNLLSTIAYFSYDVDPHTGAYTNPEAIEDWKQTALIDSAHRHNVKVLLTVSSYGANDNKTFLSQRDTWGVLIDSLQQLLEVREAQGVDLNFEQIPAAYRGNFSSFVRKLRSSLPKSSLITLQVPAYNNNDAFEFETLREWVDYFIIQGYDYAYTECNGTPAPVSPLLSVNTNCPSIVNTVDYCIIKGLLPEDMILGLPVYGTLWTLKGQSWNADATFEKYLTYEEIITSYGASYEPFYDPLSGSSFFRVSKGRYTELVWFESKASLDHKFTWAQTTGLKGVALWALGYEGVQSDIWNVVAHNFGAPPLQEIQPIGYENGKTYTVMSTVAKNRKGIGVGVLIIVSFFILGLFVSLTDWRVREVFFSNFAHRAIFSGILILLVAVTIFFFRWKIDGFLLLFIGMALGGVVVYFITMRYIAYRDKLP